MACLQQTFITTTTPLRFATYVDLCDGAPLKCLAVTRAARGYAQ